MYLGPYVPRSSPVALCGVGLEFASSVRHLGSRDVWLMLRQFVVLKDGCYVRLCRLVEVFGKSVENLYLFVPIFFLILSFPDFESCYGFHCLEYSGMSYCDIYISYFVQESPEGRKMLEFRMRLPAYKEKDALLTAIARNQVVRFCFCLLVA